MGLGASLSDAAVVAVPQADNPSSNNPNNQSRFIISLLDGLMIRKLPYEKITKG
jgi:hypothetical protein